MVFCIKYATLSSVLLLHKTTFPSRKHISNPPPCFHPRQNRPFCRYSVSPLPCLCGFPGHRTGGTLDKMMNGRKSENTGRDDSDRKHLTGREVERLIEATRGSRNEARDRCLLLLMFRHGLRVSEACRMKLDQVDTESRVLHVARLKHGLPSVTTRRRIRVPTAQIYERNRGRRGKSRRAALSTLSIPGLNAGVSRVI